MDDLKGFKTSVEEGAVGVVVETARELEFRSGAWRWDWIAAAHDKTWTDEDEQRKWFLAVESTPGEDAMKILEW